MIKEFQKFVVLIGAVLPAQSATSAQYKNSEIRVVRTQLVDKQNRLELGIQSAFITNQTFIYTLMGGAQATLHFNDLLAFEANFLAGLSIDKSSKTRLQSEDYNIFLPVGRTSWIGVGALHISPVYGKFQFGNNLIYADTYLSLGGGMTGIEYFYETCKTVNRPEYPATFPYPTFAAGVGQRFFVSDQFSLRYELRTTALIVNKDDSECEAGGTTATYEDYHATLILGFSYYL